MFQKLKYELIYEAEIIIFMPFNEIQKNSYREKYTFDHSGSGCIYFCL